MDFVDDFVSPGSEEGLRLDTEFQFDPSIVVDRIVPETPTSSTTESNSPQRCKSLPRPAFAGGPTTRFSLEKP